MTLQGVRVFVVEDEALLLLALEDLLADFGCHLVACAQRLDDALSHARELDFDVAILDVNVAGQRIDPVGVLLAARGIPFLFVSGYGSASLPPGLQDRPLVAKPYATESLQTGLLRLLGRDEPDQSGPT